MVKYERLKEDPEACLKAIVEQLGWEVDEKRIARAVKNTAIAKLKKAEKKERFRETPPGKETFFGEGKSGKWKDVLTPLQAKRIEVAHRMVMEELGYL